MSHRYSNTAKQREEIARFVSWQIWLVVDIRRAYHEVIREYQYQKTTK